MEKLAEGLLWYIAFLFSTTLHEASHALAAYKLGDKTAELRPEIERVLRRFKTQYELRGAAPEEVVYVVTTPRELHTDRVSTALTELVPGGTGAVEWSERKSKDGAA